MTSALLDFCTSHQDYTWFLALLGWLPAGFVWWRTARTSPTWGWLGWAAGAGIAQALIELAMLATPVRPEIGDSPHRVGDALLNATTALAVGGWIVSSLPRVSWRWVGWLPVAVLLVLHRTLRAEANLAMAALLLVAALVWYRKLFRDDRRSVLALGAAVLGLAMSSHGAFADLLGQSRDQIEASRAGLLGGVVAMCAAWLTCVELAPRVRQDARYAAWEARRLDLRRLVRWSVGWVVAGLVLASGASWLAQRDYSLSMVARARALAELIDRAELARALGPEFQVDAWSPPRKMPSGRAAELGTSFWLRDHEWGAVRDALRRIAAASPDLRGVAIRTRLGNSLVRCFAPENGPERSGAVLIEGPFDAAAQWDWLAAAGDFRGWIDTAYDEAAQARAPLLATDGTMLGWLVLDTGVSNWMAVQVQARVQGYLAVLLGLGVAVLWFVQRWREREREEARRAASTAVEAERLKTSFLAKVSHELRTPLQTILSVGELCREETHTPEQLRRIESLLQQAQLLRRMVNDLIDLSAIEAGRLSLALRPVAVPAVFVEAAESLRARAAAKQLELFVATSGETGAVQGDADRLQQIVVNLVGNAVKFTARGHVAVEIACAPVGASRMLVRLTVSDTGPGIAPEEQAKLFRPFARVAATEHEEGAGLGLAIIAGLCAQMGGGIRLESDGRTGSRFEVRLELVRAPEAEAIAAAPVTGSLRGRRVLVADDNPYIRDLFADFLQQQGARCEVVADGAEAWAWMQHARFDAAILDISMPKVDGLELARWIRAQRPTGTRMRLVAASAHARPEDRAASLAAGFDCHLVKPVSLTELARSVIGEAAAVSAPLPPPAEPPKVGTQRAPAVPVALRESIRGSFRNSVVADLCELEGALRLRAWPELRKKAHFFKNSAIAIDDPALVDAMSRLELAAAEGNIPAIDHAWSDCRRALEPWLPATS